MVDAFQWEASRAAAREVDAAFDTELLRRAQEWRQEADEHVECWEGEGANVGDDGAAPDDQETERPVVEGTTFSGTDSSSLNGRAPALHGDEGTGPQHCGGSAPQGDGGGSQATQANGSAAAAASAAGTGLVGIMFDAGM